MFTRLIDNNRATTYAEDDEGDCRFCRHGHPHDDCQACEDENDIDIDKCLNCGHYKASSSLNRDQVCMVRCVNPNEY